MKIVLLGATGNIGQQAIDVINKLHHKLVGISYYNNIKEAKKLKCEYYYSPIKKEYSNVNSYDELIRKSKPDLVVNAIGGFAGLNATLSTINNKIDLALANKESLVVAGKFVTKLAKKHKVNIYPIDSEHASIYQILKQNNNLKFDKLFITASGGPFYNYSKKQLTNITYEQAIKHPTWKMGNDISINSSTLINKCFEMIEAYWYFKTKNIEPLYHPTSYIHALVKFNNNKTYMFCSKPDMHLPIELAINKFNKNVKYVKPLNDNNQVLEKIDLQKHPVIKLGYDMLRNPTSALPIIINASNEQALDLFKNKKITYLQILDLINLSIKKFSNYNIKSLKDVYELNNKVREFLIKKFN